MPTVLGISSTGHDSSAALFVDGRLVAAISEERLSRVKCEGRAIPSRAIDNVLGQAGLTRRDVTHIGLLCGFFPETDFWYLDPLKEMERRLSRLRRRLSGAGPRSESAVGYFREASRRGKTLADCFRRDEFLAREGFRSDVQVRFSAHHEIHAVLAGFYSGFGTATVITMDGYGDNHETHTTNSYRHGRMECLHTSYGTGQSAGIFYQTITELLGFRPLRHEGKVLGLAAFGAPGALADPFRRALRLAPDGARLESDFPDLRDGARQRSLFLKDAIVGHSRETVAAAAQSILEETVVPLVRNAVMRTNLPRVALNGGVFANVKLNQRIAALPEVERIFVYPAMSDAGNSVGAALLTLEEAQPGFLAAQEHALTDVYLGPRYADTEIETDLRVAGLRYEKLDEAALIERAAQSIHAGLVVGWFHGRMEFGPRALGNRSMIGRPTDADINKSLNDRLERTEFMPFAPSVLAERADEIFIGIDKAEHPAEFMTVTFDVREEWKARIPAVVHVDGTARPQLVRADRNPLYHAVIKRYGELSGIPLVLNTSFNVHEEPIVCAPAEGIRALSEDRIDALAIGSYWVDNPLLTTRVAAAT